MKHVMDAKKASCGVSTGEQYVEQLVGQHLLVGCLLGQLIEKDISLFRGLESVAATGMCGSIVKSLLHKLTDEATGFDCRLRKGPVLVEEH